MERANSFKALGVSSSSSSSSPVAAAEGVPLTLPGPLDRGARFGLFKGWSFRLEGDFEVGEGGWKNPGLGKRLVKAWLESFGGVVTQAITSETSFLVVGRYPDVVAVGKARENGLLFIDIATLKFVLENPRVALAAAPEPATLAPYLHEKPMGLFPEQLPRSAPPAAHAAHPASAVGAASAAFPAAFPAALAGEKARKRKLPKAAAANPSPEKKGKPVDPVQVASPPMTGKKRGRSTSS